MDEQDRPGEVDRHDESGAAMTAFSALAARMDPVPSTVLEAARATFTWRTIDAELAELAFDSVLAGRELAGTRGTTAGPRLLTFEAPGLTIELEVSEVGARRHLVGQLVPAGAAELELRHPAGTTATTADAMGRFRAEEVAAGPISVRVRRGDAEPVETDWVSV